MMTAEQLYAIADQTDPYGDVVRLVADLHEVLRTLHTVRAEQAGIMGQAETMRKAVLVLAEAWDSQRGRHPYAPGLDGRCTQDIPKSSGSRRCNEFPDDEYHQIAGAVLAQHGLNTVARALPTWDGRQITPEF